MKLTTEQLKSVTRYMPMEFNPMDGEPGHCICGQIFSPKDEDPYLASINSQLGEHAANRLGNVLAHAPMDLLRLRLAVEGLIAAYESQGAGELLIYRLKKTRALLADEKGKSDE